MKYWLFKSEPHEYSIEDLQRAPRKTGRWDGIRNYQARNLLRDEVKKGDVLFFYHSNANPSGIVGMAEVTRAAYPDPAQFDRSSKYFDPRAVPETPRWYCVDVKFRERFGRVIPLAELKEAARQKGSALKDMVLLRQGRLSIQPVSAGEWKAILKMLCLLLALSPGMAVRNGEAAELETVVVTGRADGATRGEIPGSVGVVDALDLSLVQASHINEAADRIAGVWISRGNGQEHLTAIRSPVLTGPGSCGAFLVLEDGVPTRPAGFCNVNQLFEINSEQAERIEIYRGTNTAVYGSSALHGVINVVTPGVGELEKGGVTLDGGPHDYARLFTRYSDGKGLAMNAHADHDGGFKDDSGYDQQKLNVKSLSRVADWNATTFAEFTNLNQETASYIDGDEAYRDDSQKNDNPHPQAYRDAKSAHGYSKWHRRLDDKRSVELTPYANMSRMDFLQHFIRGTPTERNGHFSAGLNGKFHYPLAFADDSLAVVSGFNIESGRAHVDQYQELDIGSPLFPQGQHYDFEVWMNSAALFTELEYEFAPAWKVIGGFRYDHQLYDYENKAVSLGALSVYSPVPSRDDEYGEWGAHAGVIWQLQPRHQAYFNYSHGFRIPQVAEIYRLQGAPPGQLVDSEQMESVELGWRGKFVDLPGDRLLYEVALFGMRKKDVILQDSNRQYLGNGITDHEGVELTLNYWLTPTAYLNLAGTYAEHRYDHIERPLFSTTGDVDGKIIDTAPRRLGSMQIGKVHSWGLIEIEWKHMGPYYLDPEHDWEYEGHDLINFRAQYWQRSDLKWTARLLNVADTDYAERADVRPAVAFPVPIPEVPRYFVGEPRSLYLSVEMTF